jgi:hypothetical protein
MERRLDAVVDVMRVPASGDANVAVLTGRRHDRCRRDRMRCAGRRRRHGRRRCGAGGRAPRLPHLPDRGDRLARRPAQRQGVSALDEHEHIEAFGGTASYYALRNALRDHYRGAAGAAGREPAFNPGDCWVSRIAFEPAAGATRCAAAGAASGERAAQRLPALQDDRRSTRTMTASAR